MPLIEDTLWAYWTNAPVPARVAVERPRSRLEPECIMGPLQDIRILDLTTVLMGPYATSILGDMGADVIKLEPPGGDLIRQVGPSRSGCMGPIFMHANRSKRSIVVDLKTPAGRDVALRLAATADVLIYNIRPKAMERLGLGYESVATVRPSIIYLGAFGFGQDGPYADRPAYDDLIQTASAIPALMAESGEEGPRFVPVNIADRAVGLHAANAILAALLHRERTGEGQRIDVPMFETMASLVLGDHLGGLTYEPPLDGGGYPRLLSRHRKPFRTRDGHLCVVLYTDRHWQAFFRLAGQDWRAKDPRYATHASRIRHIDELNGMIAEILLSRTSAEWESALGERDIPCMAVQTPASLLEDPHLAATGFFESVPHASEGPVKSMRVPSHWSRTQPAPGRLAPGLGQHSRELLLEIGLSDAEVDRLVDGRVVSE